MHDNILLEIERFKTMKVAAVNRKYDSYLDKKAAELGGRPARPALSAKSLSMLKALLKTIRGN